MSTSGSEALQQSYDTTKQGLRQSIPGFLYLSPFLSNISSLTFDYVSGDVSASTQDAYALISGGVTGDVQAVFTILYSDSTKSEISSIAKTDS